MAATSYGKNLGWEFEDEEGLRMEPEALGPR
jgi:hypothetical protein